MSYSENNSFESILDRALSNDALINVDKRVGSIIYDALAPLCLELSEAYIQMDILKEQTYLLTATGKNLDDRAFDYGIIRKKATKSLRVAEFKKYKIDNNGDFVLDNNGERILVDMDIIEGIRFAVPESDLIYEYLGKIDGNNIVECEQYGTQGDKHIGTILPLSPISDLIEANVISTYKPAKDEETDDELRSRTQSTLTDVAFGGNVSDYIQKVNSIDGVGNTKVFPAWKQNGTVLLSVVDPQFNPITEEFKNNIQQQIDPEEYSGEGVGIAPIGHYVTITTPTRMNVKITATVELENEVTIGQVSEDIIEHIEAYFNSVRKNFGQDKTLSIYRARVSEAILNCDKVLNVTDVMLNDTDSDIIYNDNPEVNGQYLPYISEVNLIE